MNIYTRNCPKCNKEINYKNIKCRETAEKNKYKCPSCRGMSWSSRDPIPDIRQRNCPVCNTIINYSSKWTCLAGERNLSKCKKCTNTDSNKTLSQSIKMTGVNNPFYNKKHSLKTKNKISENIKKSWNCKSKEEIEIWRAKINTSGDRNGMYGKSVHQHWTSLYGIDEADRRWKESNKKRSINSIGKRLGQSPSHSCGRGWKGRYKNHYFRSLGELSYMIYLDENNIEWKSAETKEYMITYINENGLHATYKPDFIINKNELIEIKPTALQKTKLNQLKIAAAINFCKERGLSYNVIDMENDLEKIKSALENGFLKFSKNFEEKFWSFYKKTIT